MSKYDILEFKHLQAIVAIADAGTFTAAAAKIHIAQSALSRRIREVEDTFKIQIFERDRVRSVPTPAGETLVHYARVALEGRVETMDAVQAIQQASLRPFRLGFTSFIEAHELETVTQAYSALFPLGKMSPEIVDTADVADLLEDDELDAALVTLPLISDNYSTQKMMQEPLVVCIRKDDALAKLAALPAKALSGRLALSGDLRRHPVAHAKWMEMLTEQGIEPKNGMPSLNREQVQWMVRRGFVVALIREDEPLHEDLTTRPIEGVKWTIDSALIYKVDHNQLALPLLLRDLRSRFPDDDEANVKKPPARASVKEAQQKLSFDATQERP
jgi:DNA-binding transcriptional LysR family regulator